MKILFVGDVYGSPGRDMIQNYLGRLKNKYRPDLTIINGENSANGKGITEKIYKQLMEWGADVITLGNHAWDNKDIFDFIDGANRMVRPANFPKDTPGQGMLITSIQGVKVAIINLQGRTFMPPLDDPFQEIDHLVAEAKKQTNIIFVDFHAEATSEKLAIGWHLDGKVSAVVGTHTHVQTADERVLPRGTAYITDVGMTGPYNGILGVDRESVIRKFQTSLPVRFDVSKDPATQLSAVLIDVDNKTGLAKQIDRILINDDHLFFIE